MQPGFRKGHARARRFQGQDSQEDSIVTLQPGESDEIRLDVAPQALKTLLEQAPAD